MFLGLLAWLSALVLLTILLAKRYQSWSIGFLSAATVHSYVCVMAIQLLSRASLLQAQALTCFWVLIAVALTFALCRHREMLPLPTVALGPLSCGVAIYLLLLLYISIEAPPNNYDSMTYHMSRVMHWMQNGSVASFANGTFRQIVYSPGAEYNILNLHLLTGNDILANTVQWSAMLISVVASGQLPSYLKAGPAANWLSAIFCITLPMGILQSTSTQTDYAAAGWTVVAVLFGLRALNESVRSKNIECVALCAMSSGLALLTKGTAAMVLAPFIVAFAISFVRKFGLWSIKPALSAVSLAGILLSGFYTDNWTDSSGKFFQYVVANVGNGITNEVYSPAVTASCLIRNLATQLATPIPFCNSVLSEAVAATHRLTGLAINDPRTTFGNSFSLVHGGRQLHEDFAGYAGHALLAMLLLTGYLIRGKPLHNKRLLCYGVSLVVSYVMLCSLLKWQPWGTRLFLPFFVLLSPLVASAATPLLSERTKNAICGALLILGLPWLCDNRTRPLIGANSLLLSSRESNYFRTRPRSESQYKKAASILSAIHPSQIMLVTQGDAFVYPLWVLLSKQAERPRIEWTTESVPFAYINRPMNKPSDCVIVDIAHPDLIPEYKKTHRLLLEEPDIAVLAPLNSDLEVKPLKPSENK